MPKTFVRRVRFAATAPSCPEPHSQRQKLRQARRLTERDGGGVLKLRVCSMLLSRVGEGRRLRWVLEDFRGGGFRAVCGRGQSFKSMMMFCEYL